MKTELVQYIKVIGDYYHCTDILQRSINCVTGFDCGLLTKGSTGSTSNNVQWVGGVEV